MRKAICALLLAVMLVILPAPAHAADGCIINILGVRVCGTLVGQPLPPVVTVTVTPNPLPPVTIRPPAQTVTVTPPTVTVRPPGAAPVTETVTVRPPAAQPSGGPTATVTQNNNTTQTARPGQSSTATVTAAPSPSALPEADAAQQPEPAPVDRERDTEQPPFLSPDVDLGDDSFTIGEGGFLVGMVALILMALYAGYIIGYKDKQREEISFGRALLDQVRLRK